MLHGFRFPQSEPCRSYILRPAIASVNSLQQEADMTAREPGFRANIVAVYLLACAVCFAGQRAAAEEPLFVSKRMTPPGEYTSDIEGPAVDASGNLYVVNFQQSGTIGSSWPAPFADRSCSRRCRSGSIGNGIRLDRQGRMHVADFKKHNVWVMSPAKPRRKSISIPTASTSRTTWRSPPTARSMPATPTSRAGGRPDLAHHPRADGKRQGEIMSRRYASASPTGSTSARTGTRFTSAKIERGGYRPIASTATSCSIRAREDLCRFRGRRPAHDVDGRIFWRGCRPANP